MPALARSSTDLHIAFDDPAMDVAVNALFHRAFGPGRFAKTAERLRETNAPLRTLSRLAFQRDALVGAAKVWPIRFADCRGVFFGPFAVEETHRSAGLGRALVQACCEAAAAESHGVMLLIGAAEFFEPIGFSRVPAGQITMPGPVDPARLLWRAFEPDALSHCRGHVRPGWLAP